MTPFAISRTHCRRTPARRRRPGSRAACSNSPARCWPAADPDDELRAVDLLQRAEQLARDLGMRSLTAQTALQLAAIDALTGAPLARARALFGLAESSSVRMGDAAATSRDWSSRTRKRSQSGPYREPSS